VSFSHDQFGHPGATTASAGSATNRRHHWAKSGDASYRGVTVSVRLSAPARREQILDVAVQVFARQGFHSTSMNDVADAAGVTKPVLYQHFASKHDLYMALLDEAGTRLRTRITTAVADARTGKEQTELGFKAYFRWVADDHDAFLLLFGLRASRDEESTNAIRRITAAAAEGIAPLIAAGIEADHQRMLAQGLVGLAEAVSRHMVERNEAFDPDVLGQQIADLAWAGLRAVHRA
jgi:AcrR family transcriptional regulator